MVLLPGKIKVNYSRIDHIKLNQDFVPLNIFKNSFTISRVESEKGLSASLLIFT